MSYEYEMKTSVSITNIRKVNLTIDCRGIPRLASSYAIARSSS